MKTKYMTLKLGCHFTRASNNVCGWHYQFS